MRPVAAVVTVALLGLGILIWGMTKSLPHPIFLTQDWVFDTSEDQSFVDPGSNEPVPIYEPFFKHPNGKWFKGEHFVFGEVIVRGYGIEENGKLLKHWVQVKQGNRWETFGAWGTEWKWLKDSPSGKITAVRIILKDADGKEIARREIKRKM